jgi:hypothetical protein
MITFFNGLDAKIRIFLKAGIIIEFRGGVGSKQSGCRGLKPSI